MVALASQARVPNRNCEFPEPIACQMHSDLRTPLLPLAKGSGCPVSIAAGALPKSYRAGLDARPALLAGIRLTAQGANDH